jgi:hypothetical protein
MKKRYFHGGNRGLQVGGYILPPAETGAKTMAEWNPLVRSDRVYVTPHIDQARFYASGADNPVVYEVTIPEGDLEADPDCNVPGLSFACPKAKITAIQ